MSAATAFKTQHERAEPFSIWPDPTPLPNGLPPVAPFDLRMMPRPLAEWVGDISERMQSPPEFVAVTAMVTAGAAVGRKVGIRPQQHTDWYEVPNLWGCVIGRPGVMKSPSMKQAMAPLFKLEAEAREQHATAMAEFKAFEVERELRGKAVRAAIEKRLKSNPDADLSDLARTPETEPSATRYIVNDGGYQALSEVLRNCAPNGVLSFRDELMSLLRALDDESRVEDRGFYLTGWDGTDSYTSDRIGRGFNLHIPAVTISLLGSTQPGKIVNYIADALNGGAGDDGLIQRFGMLVWPDQSPDWREVDREPCRLARTAAFNAFERLAALTPDQVDAEVDEFHSDRAFLRFRPDAQQEFKAWWSKLEHRLRSDELHPAMESHLSKYRKLVPSLALLHHLLSGYTGPVCAESLLAACAWGEFLETHAQRLYGAATDRAGKNAKVVLRHILKGDLGSTFTARDVHQKGWSGLTETGAVAAALERLEVHHYVRMERRPPGPTGGRASEVCIVNPKVLDR